MGLEKHTEEELIEESKKRVKKTGCYTRKAMRAQRKLYDDFVWGDKDFKVKDNGITDLDYTDLIYDGYEIDNETDTL